MPDSDRTTEELRSRFAAAFGYTTDPLKRYESVFDALGADPFELFVTEVLEADGISERTLVQYETAYRQWREYMREMGRHPACPNDAHVRGFAHWLQTERDNGAIETIRQKLHKLNRAYRFWQKEPSLPHTQEYDPFSLGREKIRWGSFDDTENKSPPHIPRGKLRSKLATITDLRVQIPIVTQLKLGLRVGELCNIQLQDINVTCPELRRQYPLLGTHDGVSNRPDAIYIPGRDERAGNKSAVPRVLPLDDELQRAIIQYLRVRPSWVDTWAFLSREDGQLDDTAINNAWKDTFQPEYAESDDHRAVTSHFGRHYFTSYWRKEQDLPKELVQYMRGDRLGEPERPDSWMHNYLHVYYEDIEERFRQDIYELGIPSVDG